MPLASCGKACKSRILWHGLEDSMAYEHTYILITHFVPGNMREVALYPALPSGQHSGH